MTGAPIVRLCRLNEGFADGEDRRRVILQASDPSRGRVRRSIDGLVNTVSHCSCHVGLNIL